MEIYRYTLQSNITIDVKKKREWAPFTIKILQPQHTVKPKLPKFGAVAGIWTRVVGVGGRCPSQARLRPHNAVEVYEAGNGSNFYLTFSDVSLLRTELASWVRIGSLFSGGSFGCEYIRFEK
jgi:hypothetical protein